MQHRLYGLRGKCYALECQRIFLEEGQKIRQKFLEIKKRDGKFTCKALGELCNHFQLPVTVMDRFLVDLNLYPFGTWERLKNRGLKAKDIGVSWE